MGDRFSGYAAGFALVAAVCLACPLPAAEPDEPATMSKTMPVPQSLLKTFLVDDSTFTLIDARTPEEFASSHIAGAINLPHDADPDSLAILPPNTDAPIVVYCGTGARAARLEALLRRRGYTNVGVLAPEQIVWFDGLAVFNCGVPGAQASESRLRLTAKDRGEEEKL